MTRLRGLLIIPPVILGVAMVWSAMSRQPEPALVVPQERQTAVTYISAAPRIFVPQVEGYGTVVPARVWTAIAQVAGTVEYLHPAFARGGFIPEDEVLVRINAEDAELALDSADADLNSATARLEELLVSQNTTTAALLIERRSFALVEQELARTQRLAKKGVVSASVVQSQEREKLAQQSKVQSLESTLALLPAQIRSQEQSIAKAVVAKQMAELDVARTIITAPFDARVASAEVEIGQYVGAGSTVGVLDSASVAEIDVQISQRQMLALARLAVAAKVSSHGVSARSGPVIRPACLSGSHENELCDRGPEDPRALSASVWPASDRRTTPWPAEVARVSDTVTSETRSLGIIVSVDGPYALSEGVLRPPLIKGTFVRVALSAPDAIDAILVPRAAIRSGRVMLVGAGNRLKFAPVTTLFTFDGIAVLAPTDLPKDARIITSAPSPAVEGLLLAPEFDALAEDRISDAAEGSKL